VESVPADLSVLGVFGEWLFDVDGAFRMKIFVSFSLALLLVSTKVYSADVSGQNAKLSVYCNTKHSALDGTTVKRNFFIVFRDKNVVVGADRIFFGGAKFYFDEGYSSEAKFLVSNRRKKFTAYKKEDFEKRNLVFLREGGYFLSISNLEAEKTNATFNLKINPTGLVAPRITDWEGQCRQLGFEDRMLSSQLQSLENASK
jgi:hypothetical protein